MSYITVCVWQIDGVSLGLFLDTEQAELESKQISEVLSLVILSGL